MVSYMFETTSVMMQVGLLQADRRGDFPVTPVHHHTDSGLVGRGRSGANGKSRFPSSGECGIVGGLLTLLLYL